MGGTVGGILEWDTARKEGKRQQQTAQNSIQFQQQMYDQMRADSAPWRDAGVSALGDLSNLGYKTFSAEDFQQDPGYQFRMDEAMKAIEGSAAARGMRSSPATMKSMSKYASDLASSEYQNAYNRFNNDRDTRFNQLASLAGIGQVANTQIGQAGQNLGTQYGNLSMQGAQARSAGNLGGLRAFNQGVDDDKQMMTQAMGMFMSDEREKENITDISKKEIQEFVQSIKPKIFSYINSDNGEGLFPGVMAQDLEKTKLGRMIVFENNRGQKVIDTNKAVMLLLAISSEAA